MSPRLTAESQFMPSSALPALSRRSTPRLKNVACDADALTGAVAVLEVQATPEDLIGRRARQFVEHDDKPLFGQAKRAVFELDAIAFYLELYRHTDDGSMTLYVDLEACVDKAVSPVAFAVRCMGALGLSSSAVSYLHTGAEERFWRQVDPLKAAKAL